MSGAKTINRRVTKETYSVYDLPLMLEVSSYVKNFYFHKSRNQGFTKGPVGRSSVLISTN
uniref:AsIV-cont00048-ORF2 n=1 Tax=Apophua simplicipes ichnovirus TaxID=1329648 RepID=S5DR60_9VIRU|nr:AsIV-cont00048-ORF2 [Apophua simplicipes ichnovirus]